MKNKDKIAVFPSILEMAIIIIILVSGFEALKQFGGLDIPNWQWHIITVIYSAIVASVVLYFILKKYIKHNRQLAIEIKYLKKIEAGLKEKVAELSHFKDLIVWWEKKIIDIEQDMAKIKDKLDLHEGE